jgi:hypothetical protein
LSKAIGLYSVRPEGGKEYGRSKSALIEGRK